MFKAILYLLLFVSIEPLIAGTAVTWNGQSYTVPTVGEENWFGDDKVDGLLVDLATDGFQKTGGSFVLTSEVDFGATAGLIASYWGTRSSNDSTAGVFRLANAESIGWRNGANSGNILLTVDSSNSLTFNGVPIASSSGLIPVTAGGTGISSYAVGDLLYVTPNTTTLAKLPIGITDYVLKSNGTVPSWGQIVNASIDNSAAISRSKIASGSASHVIINDGSGNFSSEASLDETRGGTGQTVYAVGDILYATPNTSTLTRLPIGSTGQVLKSNGTIPEWGSASAGLAITSAKTGDYQITDSDDVVLISPTFGTVIAMLPQASANSGKIFHIKRDSTSLTHVGKVSPFSGDTINGTSVLSFGASNGWLTVVSDGNTNWQLISRATTPTQQRFTSGNGTYVTPNGVLYLRVRMVGGGGGGAGGGSSASTTGDSGGNTTFGTSLLTATGGSGGEHGAGGGVSGGGGTINSPAFGTAINGGIGGAAIGVFGAGVNMTIAGGAGGGTPMGGSSTPSVTSGTGATGRTNTGAGGSGGAFNSNTGGSGSSGSGGGGGGYIDAIIPNPLANYSYSVGAGGGGSANAGSGGTNGGTGAAGYIEVTEYYN